MSLENISKTAYCIIENRDSQLETCIRTTERIISSGWRTKTASLHLKLSLSLIFITLCFPCNCIIFLHNYADIKKITNLTLSRLDLFFKKGPQFFPQKVSCFHWAKAKAHFPFQVFSFLFFIIVFRDVLYSLEETSTVSEISSDK